MQNTEELTGQAFQQINELYKQRSATTQQKAAQLHRQYNQLSFVRLAAFLVGMVAVGALWTVHLAIGAVATLLFIMSFYRFVIWHQKIKEEAVHNERLQEINEKELRALHYDFSVFEQGKELIDPSHPYLIDLDLFGAHSVFQACNRTVSILGKKRLASFLTHPASVEEIRQRQEAVLELAPLVSWRQDFQALAGGQEDDEKQLYNLKRWLEMPAFFEGRNGLKIMLAVVPIWMFAGLTLCMTLWPIEAFLLFLILPAFLLRQNFERITEHHERTAKAVATLEKYGRLIEHVEGLDFGTSLLQQAKHFLASNPIPASKSITKLAYIISQLNVRYNPFAIVLSLFVLWEMQWFRRLDKWKAQYGTQLPDWFEGLQTFDVMNSMAVLQANNPDWIMPEITTANEIQATSLGHPLIHSQKRVNNDIILPTNGHIKLITGSNMGGKSTFLRTVGLNVVLAMSGLPVCAKTFALPPMWVYTSMRTQDSLHENTSSFWAELKRLKTIIEAVEDNKTTKAPHPQVLFLLDEILKGTNSADRHKGSRALILQLIEAQGSGLVATHDLELGDLAGQFPEAIENWCFEVNIDNGKLHFDYKLKKGISKSFNATILMQEMGIRVKN